MGILDHSRTWHFETSLSPAECLRAFASCLGNRSGVIMGSRWVISTSGGNGAGQAVATYEGRGGVVGALSGLSSRAQQEENAAAGSQLSFAAKPNGNGKTACTMAMTRVARVYLLFTADARFFRGAMNRVARRLEEQDANLELVKS